ncbi:hypothetical protein IV487_01760 [Enterococcus saccharolyticus]|uniref:hypothetical protein n=1 Tax=Enterococcus saccharolyticus TaxID=41997 RepID=UPI001E323B0B|nr:hypothetical protein [Enterococcus saccharolyticus]MCD5001189.1 hypothetical protein [Enterococcus saccharolyticus]
MESDVLDKLKIGNKTSVTLSPVPDDIKIGSEITDENGIVYSIIGVGMVRPVDAAEDKDRLDVLVKGEFVGNKVKINH